MSSIKLSRIRQMIFGFYISGIMSLLMSGVIVFINTGIDNGFVYSWMSSFVVAWAVAFPSASIMTPLAGKMTAFTIRWFDKEIEHL